MSVIELDAIIRISTVTPNATKLRVCILSVMWDNANCHYVVMLALILFHLLMLSMVN